MNATRQKSRRPRTPEQEAAAKERRERIQGFARAVAQMTPDQRQAMIDKAGGDIRNLSGHPLSVKNSCLILWQRRDATIVAGFRQWLKAGRAVRKGETGVSIRIPLKSGDKDSDGDGASEDALSGGLHFGVATVFDICQTEPKEAQDAEQADEDEDADGEQEAADAHAQAPQRVTIHTQTTAAQGITGIEQMLFF